MWVLYHAVFCFSVLIGVLSERCLGFNEEEELVHYYIIFSFWCGFSEFRETEKIFVMFYVLPLSLFLFFAYTQLLCFLPLCIFWVRERNGVVKCMFNYLTRLVPSLPSQFALSYRKASNGKTKRFSTLPIPNTSPNLPTFYDVAFFLADSTGILLGFLRSCLCRLLVLCLHLSGQASGKTSDTG
jgi:hypothetical protein